MSGSEAYRNAYAAGGMNDASIRQEAHRLSRLPHIAEAVTRLREQDSEMVHATEKVRSDWIIERLMDEASNFKNPASSRVRALEILGESALTAPDVLSQLMRPPSQDRVNRGQ